MEVKFAYGNSSDIESVQGNSGQILFAKDKPNLEIYFDYEENNENHRKKISIPESIDITYAEYQLLSEEEKNNGAI